MKLCIICKKENLNQTNKKCTNCYLNNLKAKNNWRKKQKELGLCNDCKKPSNGKYRCEECQKKNRISRKKHEKLRLEQGLCSRCYETAITKSLCEKHWFQSLAFEATGTKKTYKALKKVLENQEYICPYSGEKIIPGINASIDHIIPVSKGGSNNIENLQWVTKQMNTVKNDLTHQEFIELCSRIYKKFQISSV